MCLLSLPARGIAAGWRTKNPFQVPVDWSSRVNDDEDRALAIDE